MTVGENRAARYTDLFASGEHPHSEPASDCAYCPICTTISVVRKAKPEILDHLAVAARELSVVAAILLEEAAEFIGPPEKPRRAPAQPAPDADHDNVRHIG